MLATIISCRAARWWCRPPIASRRPGRSAAVAATATLLPPSTLGSAQLLYAVAGAPGHSYPGHPECPERVTAILDALDKASLTAAARPGQASRRVCLELPRPLHAPQRSLCNTSACPRTHIPAASTIPQIAEVADFPPAALENATSVHFERYIEALQVRRRAVMPSTVATAVLWRLDGRGSTTCALLPH